MNFLQEIVSRKYGEVEELKSRLSPESLKRMSRTVPLANFKAALEGDGLQIIAEIKRKSPSKGVLVKKVDPVSIALDYQRNGAAALSVLTDETYFGGSLTFLREIKAAVSLPVLRKDFIISEYQVYESWVAGADAILLIAEAMELNQLKRLHDLATDLGLSVLMEFHNLDRLPELRSLKADILGVNSRNLETMKTDLQRFKMAADQFPPGVLKVAESGIQSSQELRYVQDLGYDAALIGTAFMKSSSPGSTLKDLLSETRV
jgi:indole-3-glycerol phosphate synthase